MNVQLLWLFAFLVLLILLIAVSEFLYQKLNFKPETSRKFLHVTGGLVSLFLPLVFKSHWWLLILATITFLVLFITYKRKMLASVHQVQRNSVGSILFPIPVYLCFLFAELQQEFIYYYIPVSLLAFSDTAAEAGGSYWGPYTRKFFDGQKTLAGTVCFFITAIFICIFWLSIRLHLPVIRLITVSFLIACISTITELLTLKGWDNLTVPLITLIPLYLI